MGSRRLNAGPEAAPIDVIKVLWMRIALEARRLQSGSLLEDSGQWADGDVVAALRTAAGRDVTHSGSNRQAILDRDEHNLEACAGATVKLGQ